MKEMIRIGDRYIGNKFPVLIIAEIGSNFENLEQAKESIDAAKKCGVDSVKFQTYKADNLVIKKIRFPKEAGGRVQYELFKETELSEEAHRELFKYARKRGLIVFSTPSHQKDVDLLEKLGVEVYKIGSDDLTNIPLIEYVAKKKKPLIISTGMSTFEEVKEAVGAAKKVGNKDLIVLQCTSNYPVNNLEVVNLNVIRTYQNKLGVLTGYSDHSTTTSLPIAAVALGAKIIEKHFTLDKNISAPDAFHSADPKEMRVIVNGVREVEKAMGNGIKKPEDDEIAMRRNTRKSVVSVMNIEKGKKIIESMIDIKRPGYGIVPKEKEKVIGSKAKINIKKDTVLDWSMLE